MELKLKKIEEGVFKATDDVVIFDNNMVAFIKGCASQNIRKRARICAHQKLSDNLHEMLIAIGCGSYIHPHKHIGKTESLHIIEGKADVIIFSDDGGISNVIELDRDNIFFYRLNTEKYHSLLIYSPILVIHEVTNGPFLLQENNFANFAPTEGSLEVIQYTLSLKQAVLSWKRSNIETDTRKSFSLPLKTN